MRTQTFISSMVGVAAAVSVAGSANAAIVDPFTQASDAVATSTAYQNVTSESQSGSWLGGLFDTRQNSAIRDHGGVDPFEITARSQIGAGPGGGPWVGRFTSGSNTSNTSYVALNYTNADRSAVEIDFNKVTIDLAFAGTTRSAGSYIEVSFDDNNEGYAFNCLYLTGSELSASSLTMEFSMNQFTDYGLNWNEVTRMSVVIGSTGAGAGQTWTATNFQMTAVPAPGAAALIGLAGLVASRRRRN